MQMLPFSRRQQSAESAVVSSSNGSTAYGMPGARTEKGRVQFT